MKKRFGRDVVADAKEFAEVWMRAYKEKRDRRWVGEQLGISRQQTYNRYHNLKKRGLSLPPLPKQYLEKDEIEEVNKWVAKEMNENVS